MFNYGLKVHTAQCIGTAALACLFCLFQDTKDKRATPQYAFIPFSVFAFFGGA
jgi:hypothetical protein